MRYKITGRNINVTPGLKAAVEEKIGKLERYFNQDTEVNITQLTITAPTFRGTHTDVFRLRLAVLRILDLRRRPDLFRHRIHIKQRHRRQNTVKNKQNRHHADAAASDCHFPPKYRIPSHVSAPPSLLHVL